MTKLLYLAREELGASKAGRSNYEWRGRVLYPGSLRPSVETAPGREDLGRGSERRNFRTASEPDVAGLVSCMAGRTPAAVS